MASRRTLPATLRLGVVELTVSDLERSVAFYRDSLGLRVRGSQGGRAVLGVGEDGAGDGELLILHELPGSRPAGRHAGLYHFALLYPSRVELARATRRLVGTGTSIDGASDHGVSEAVYLSDPDGNGIELYADRPRAQWPAPNPGERVGMYTVALDLDGLLELGSGEPSAEHAASGLVVGHVHLQIGNVDRALAFYRDLMGFEEMVALPSAAFVSAGGYHHHLGLNTWRGEGVGPVPENTVGLRRWTVVLEDAGQVRDLGEAAAAAGVQAEAIDHGIQLRDPWGIAVLLLADDGRGAV